MHVGTTTSMASGRPANRTRRLSRPPTFSNLPPAHIHYAEYDPLADDGPGYAERLRAAGNHVELRCAERMIHGFMRARFSGPDAAAEFAKPCDFIRRVLGL